MENQLFGPPSVKYAFKNKSIICCLNFCKKKCCRIKQNKRVAEDAKMKIKTSANYLATWTKIPLMTSKNDSYSQTHWEPKIQQFGLIEELQWKSSKEHTILGVLSWKLTTIAQRPIQFNWKIHHTRRGQTKVRQNIVNKKPASHGKINID